MGPSLNHVDYKSPCPLVYVSQAPAQPCLEPLFRECWFISSLVWAPMMSHGKKNSTFPKVCQLPGVFEKLGHVSSNYVSFMVWVGNAQGSVPKRPAGFAQRKVHYAGLTALVLDEGYGVWPLAGHGRAQAALGHIHPGRQGGRSLQRKQPTKGQQQQQKNINVSALAS